MQKIGILLVGMGLLGGGLSIDADSTVEEPTSRLSLVEAYYEALEGVRQADSKKADVDRLVQLLDDGFRYEHPRFGADFSKEEMKAGILRVMDMQRASSIEVVEAIEGLDAAFVKVESRAEVKRGETWTEVSGTETALFEFKEGKISRIHEYW